MMEYKNKILLGCLYVLLALFWGNYANSNSLNSRETYVDLEHNLLLGTNSPSTINTELNTVLPLQVQLLSNSLPVASANIDWKVTQLISSTNRQTAYIIVDGTKLTLHTQATDDNGISQINLNTGEVASVYRVIASVSVYLNDTESVELSREFVINSGIQSSIKNNTPENQVAISLDNLCPQLEENQSSLTSQQLAMLERCNTIQQAIGEGKSVEVSKALREMSPEEVAVQADIGTGFSNQQVANVATRLLAVRKGVNRLSFSNLNFNYRGKQVPLGYMLNALSLDEASDNVGGGLLDNKLGLFINGNLNIGSRETTSNSDGFEFDSYGMTAGADYRINSKRFAGAALGISKSNVEIIDKGGELTANGFSLSVYLSQYLSDQWYVDGVINLGNSDYDMDRTINYSLNNTLVDYVAKSNTKGFQKGITVSSGYEMQDGELSTILFGSASYTSLDIDSYKETGAQELNLSIDKQSISTTNIKFGAQLQYTHSSRKGVFIPFIGLNWFHEFSGSDEIISGSFGDEQYNSSFRIKTDKPDTDYFTNYQGITAILPKGISAYIRLENTLGKDYYKITNVTLGGRMELSF